MNCCFLLMTGLSRVGWVKGRPMVEKCWDRLAEWRSRKGDPESSLWQFEDGERANGKRAICLLMSGIVTKVLRGMDEPPPLSGPNRCPVCGARIPFSLAQHMVAAHSPGAKARAAELADFPLPGDHGLAHSQPQSKSASERNGANHSRGKWGFVRRNGKRSH